MADLKSVDAVADPDTPEAAADPDRPEAAFASTDPAADPEPTEAVADPQQVSASPNAVEGTDEKENAAPLLHNVSPNMVAAFDALSLEQVHELEAVAACRFGTWLQTAEDLEREAEFGGYEEVVGSYHTVNDPRFEVVDWTRLGPVTDTENEVYVVPNVLGPEQCDAILAAVSARAKKRGGWQVDRHEYFPTTDMRCAEACADAPAMEQMVRAAVFEKICEPLASHWAGSRFLAEHLVFRDFFFVHYSAAEGEQRGLNMHADGSLFSFNVLLTDPAEFEGGGTFFSLPYAPHGHGKTVSVPRGAAVVHSGSRRHGARDVTRGTRDVLVGFMGEPRHVPEVPVGVVSPEICQQAARESYHKFGLGAWSRGDPLEVDPALPLSVGEYC